jgi:hypothetical protein
VSRSSLSRSLIVLGVVLGMMLGVMLGRLLGVMGGVQPVGVRHMGVMTGLLVIAVFVVLGGLAVMVRRALVMVGRVLMMLGALVRLRAHLDSSCCWASRRQVARARLIEMSDSHLTPM